MKKIIYLFFFITIISCVKLPIQTITLTEAIINEGKRMHQLNISLINKMFDVKRERIDAFIKNEYTPKYLDEFQNKVPAGVNYEQEFSDMIKSIIPIVNSRRDMMQSTLETQRVKLITNINADYKVFEEASNELKRLVESGVKVSEERKKIFEQVTNLSQSKIDLNQVDTEIDKFIIKAGDVSKNINDFNSKINSLLNK